MPKLTRTKLLAETYRLSRLDNLCTPGQMTSTVVSSGDTAKVLGEVTPRLYVVQTQDGLVRRNRIHLRPSDCEPQVPCDQQPLPEQPVIANGVDVGNSAETIVPNPNSGSPNENSLPPVQTFRYGSTANKTTKETGPLKLETRVQYGTRC